MATTNDANVLKQTFTAGQAAKATGVAYHQINYWATTKFLVPSVQKARGSHTCRGYSFKDLVALRVAGRLREAGVGLQGLRKVVSYLQSRGYGHPLAEAYLVVAHDGDVIAVEEDKLISALKNRGQTCFVFALRDAVQDLFTVTSTLKRPTRGKASKVA
jgi:DNA-binding transcriptional MerR regulator